MAKSFIDDFNSGMEAWIPEMVKKIQQDFQIDTNAKLQDVSIVKDGEGYILKYELPDKSETNIPTEDKQVWVPATSYTTKDKKTGRRVSRKRKGYTKTVKAEVSNINRSNTAWGETDNAKSSANSAYRVVEMARDFTLGDDLPQFLHSYLSSKGWNVERE
jgi:HSP20 family molecular chaperone IbpA